MAPRVMMVAALGLLVLTASGCESVLPGLSESSSINSQVEAVVRQFAIASIEDSQGADANRSLVTLDLQLGEVATQRSTDDLLTDGDMISAHTGESLSADVYGKRVSGSVQLKPTKGDSRRRYWIENVQVLGPANDRSSAEPDLRNDDAGLIVQNASEVTAKVTGYRISDSDLLGFQAGGTLYSLNIEVLTSEPIRPSVAPAIPAGKTAQAYSTNTIPSGVFGRTIEATVRRGITDNQEAVLWISDIKTLKGE